MGTVIMHSVTSLDGYIADDHDDVGPLHDWYFNGNTPILPEPDAADGDFDHSGSGSSFRVSAASAEYVRGFWQSIGCIVMGRHLFDLVDGWEGRPPAGEHVVVVSHRPKPEGWHPEASYHFVDNVIDAIAVAQDLAGDRIVAVNAGRVGGQVFAAGLVDQVAMDVVPAVFGSGRPYFGDLGDPRLLEGPTVVVQGDGVLHTLYAVPSSRP